MRRRQTGGWLKIDKLGAMKIFRKQSWLSFSVGFFIWTLVGLSFGNASHIALVRKGVESSWLQSVLYHLTYYYVAGLAAPVVFRLSRRFPFSLHRLPGLIVLHTFLCIAFAFLVTGVGIPVYWLLALLSGEQVSPFLDTFVFSIFNPYV